MIQSSSQGYGPVRALVCSPTNLGISKTSCTLLDHSEVVVARGHPWFFPGLGFPRKSCIFCLCLCFRFSVCIVLNLNPFTTF